MTDPSERRREHLRAVIASARELHRHVAPVLSRRPGEIHARPCAGSITVVSLAPESAQLGESRASGLAAAALAGSFVLDRVPGRSTPEKRLQSFLLADAHRHHRRLAALERSGERAWLVTDELPLVDDARRKVVCDLLGVLATGDTVAPLIVELKSERQLARLIAQVDAYAALVSMHAAEIAELASVLLDRQVRFDAEPARWIVWPAPAKGGPDPRAAELAARGIRCIGYREQPDGYVLS